MNDDVKDKQEKAVTISKEQNRGMQFLRWCNGYETGCQISFSERHKVELKQNFLPLINRFYIP